MRPDMQEVLITPGRHGSGYARNEELRKIRRKHVEEDEAGWKQSCTPRGHHNWGDRKIDQKGDHVMPLKRWLNSKVGEKWDDIYSEIRANNSADTAVGAHIYTHLWGFVEQHTTYKPDGTPCGDFKYTWRTDGPRPLRKGDLYIDLQGRLARAKGPAESTAPKRIVLYVLTGNTFAVQNKKGVWFMFKYSNRMRKTNLIRKKFVRSERRDDGTVEHFYVDEPYVDVRSYYTEVHIQRDHYELLPYCHPKLYDYSSHKDQKYYLISCKTMSKKEKKELGV